MEYNEFIKRVQDAAELAVPAETEAAIMAVLGTLGELLSPLERRHLAAQLHKPLKEYVDLWAERPPKERTGRHRFNLEEFYNRVAARAGVRYPAAVQRSRAVLKVLQEAVGAGEVADLFRELPAGYEELFSGKPAGPLSPSITR
jgi:uncharacterized protein (DUF2267 family)